ncbi:MAG: hypothetical protein LBM76_03010 [Mycoplasmataceae bacterium]|jgi:hypothetical protein|nr:hypothetical protein [Mycoplasmataceae bacterium]
MKINSVNKVKKSGVKVRQPTLRELILALGKRMDGIEARLDRIDSRLDRNNLIK